MKDNLNYFKEHDLVKLKVEIQPFPIPAGTTGTVVHIYQNKTTYEVEFIHDHMSFLITLNNDKIEKL